MIVQLTASNLASAIEALPKNRLYDYPNSRTTTKIKIVDVQQPEGPIYIKRFDPNKGGTLEKAETQSISSKMLWRLASPMKPEQPINIDRVFGASYNTRSALEALLIHTPNFYLCYPGRLEKIGAKTEVKEGHKHLIYKPNHPHENGKMEVAEISNMVISEVEREVYFDSLLLNKTKDKSVDVNIERRHAQIQVLLIKAAESMGLITWVAKNDHSIQYENKRLIEMDSVIKALDEVASLQGYPKAAPAGELIDCIWFSKDGKKIPAIIEIEHSTGVTSGLTRMKGFMEQAPELAHMTYIICAPDEIREQVFKKSAKPQFEGMNIQFLPYSAVEDLYLLSQRKIKGIDNIKFFHTFLEPVINN